MGIVYKPEDLRKKVMEKREKLIKGEVKSSTHPSQLSLEAIAAELRGIKLEVERIKNALKRHGIRME